MSNKFHSGHPRARKVDQMLARRHQRQAMHAKKLDGDVDVDAAWEELKKQACADPNKATKIVMLNKDDFATALRRVFG